MRRVLVTGANGFIGQHLVTRLRAEDWIVRCAVRHESQSSQIHPDCESVIIGDLSANTDWDQALDDVSMVVHLAGRAHITGENNAIALDKFREVNFAATRRLAECAAQNDIDRFVFISSIGVLGDRTNGAQFSEISDPRPESPYAIAKLEAENWLLEHQSNYQVVIIRPPLVYGPGNPGNFLRLIRVVDSGYPLPFGSIRSLRDMIYVGNLVDFIELCLRADSEVGELYVVSDGCPISLPELIGKLAHALDTAVPVFPCPQLLLKAFGLMTGMQDTMVKLTSALEVNAEKARKDLSWQPRYSLDAGLRQTVDWYLSSRLAEGGD